MEHKKLVVPAPVNASGDDVTTWALPEGAIARLERGGVGGKAFSPDGRYLAVATKIGLWWYEVATMSPIALWETERGMISDIAFSPNGKWIAISNWDKVLKVWDVQRGVSIAQIELADFRDSFTFSPGNRWLAISNRDTGNVEFREPETGKIVSTLIGETEKGGAFMPIAFSPDTQLLASTSRDDANNDAESIIVWDVESGERVASLTGHTGYIYRLCFSPCGRFLASGGEEDGTVRVWNVESWQEINAYIGYGKSDMIPSYSPEGVLRVAVASYDDDIVPVWDLENNEKLYTADSEALVTFFNGSQLAYQYGHEFLEVWTLDDANPRRTVQTHISFVDTSESLRFSQDGKTIVAEYRYGSVLLWDIESKQARPAIPTESAAKNQHIHVSSEGELYVTSIHKNTVKLWKVGSCGSPIAEFTDKEPGRVAAFTPTNSKLALAHEGGNLIVWNVQSGDKLHAFRHPLQTPTDDSDQVWKLMFSPDGRLLISDAQYGPNVRLWDVENGEEIHELPRDKFGDVGTFSPCGQYLTGISSGKNIILWDLKRRETLTTLPFLRACEFAYSPCSSYLACGGEDTRGILLWDLKRREIYKWLLPPEGCEDVHSLKFSSCGQYLALGAAWETGMEKVPICLWEVETGKHIVTFWGHTTDVQAVAFSPNNELLASASFDGSILLWDMEPYL